MDNNSVRVNFPKSMNVKSPDIEAIAKSTETIVKILHKDLGAVVDPLQVLKQLPELLAGFEKAVADQFKEMFVHQIEAAVVTRKANILALEQKIKMIQEHVNKKIKQLEDARARIEDRYDKMGGHLEAQHTSMLKKLDSHVYQLTDQLYPEMVQKKFSFASIPAQEMLAAHSLDSTLGRSVCIHNGFKQALRQIEMFLDEREDFYNRLADLTTELLTPGTYEIPFWYAEVEDLETKERRIEVFFQWELEGKSSPLNDQEELALRETADGFLTDGKPAAFCDEELRLLREHLKKMQSMGEDEIREALNDCVTVSGDMDGERS